MGNDLSINSPRFQQQKNLKGLNPTDNLKSNINYKFNDSNNTAMIIGINNLSNTIFIPRTVKHNMRDYFVTEISEGSFQNLFIQLVQFEANSEVRIIGKNAFAYSMITNITIPQHVTEICENAFFNCQLLKQVNFQENSELNKIGEKSFSQCAIENINIPSHVKEIYPMAFYCCNQLKTVEFSENSELKIIGNKAFYNSIIEDITIPTSVVEFKDGWNTGMKNLKTIRISENGNLPLKISDDEKYILGKTDPNSDEYDSLFFSYKDITEATIPPFIKQIASNAFAYSNLESIKIPKQVTEICQYAFSNCKNLHQIEFEEISDLNIIGEYAFQETPIENMTIPKHVSKISEGTFKNCEKMQQINFYDDCELKIIDKLAFYSTNINEITIPASVIELKDEWLKFSKLNVKISENNKRYKNYNDTFIVGKSNPESEEYDELIRAKNVSELEIPSFIKRIAPYAFYSLDELKKIVIPDDSAKIVIENKAFFANSIESLIIKSNNVELKEGSILLTRNLAHIFINYQSLQCKWYNNDIIITKTDSKSEEFDNLIFARNDIVTTIIPPFVNRY